jgi:hypothetical protein
VEGEGNKTGESKTLLRTAKKSSHSARANGMNEEYKILRLEQRFEIYFKK